MSFKEIKIKYFAALKEQAGRAQESIETEAKTAREVFQEMKEKYGFKLDLCHTRLALNDEFRDFDALIEDGDEVVFIPPVAGG